MDGFRTAYERVVLVGYDVGGRVAQAVARSRPDLVRGLVVSPPLPGAGDRVLSPAAQPEFWYQAFHQLPLAEQLLDGSVPAVRDYSGHFWQHWSGPAYAPDPAELDRLAQAYGTPTLVVWPAHDPLFPLAWSDRRGEFFPDVDLRTADGSGHVTPLEAPQVLADAVADLLART